MSKMGRIHQILQSGPTNSATVFLLHGSGDTGKGFLDWMKFLLNDFSFPHIKLVFPTAPSQPYTPMNGQLSNVWFDRIDINPFVPEQTESLNHIKNEVKDLIEKEVANGIPLSRIVIGGFSMGGALSLHTAYRFVPGLAGVWGLSCFLNEGSAVYEHLKNNQVDAQVPLFMCHGENDTLVPLEWGEKTFSELKSLGVNGEFRSIPNTLHELKKKELQMLFEWIQTILPPE